MRGEEAGEDKASKPRVDTASRSRVWLADPSLEEGAVWQVHPKPLAEYPSPNLNRHGPPVRIGTPTSTTSEMTCTRVPDPYRTRASPAAVEPATRARSALSLRLTLATSPLGRDLAEASSRLLPTPLDLGVVDTVPLIEVPVPPYVIDFGTPRPGEALDPLWLLRPASSFISEPNKVSKYSTGRRSRVPERQSVVRR